jgi:hypothetical protein
LNSVVISIKWLLPTGSIVTSQAIQGVELIFSIKTDPSILSNSIAKIVYTFVSILSAELKYKKY